MNTMDKIREAVDALDCDADQREMRREKVVKDHLGLRALAAFVTEAANDANGLVMDAKNGLSSDAQLTGGAIFAQMDCCNESEVSENPVIILRVKYPDALIILAEYHYDSKTDTLSRMERSAEEIEAVARKLGVKPFISA